LLHAPLSESAFRAAAAVRSHGGVVSVDLASRRPLVHAGRRAIIELLQRAEADILFRNEPEAAAVAGPGRTDRLLELAPVVVVKQGGAGCRVLWRGGQSHVATKRIVAPDTTGAGDAFDAGFLFALLSSGFRRGGTLNAALLRRSALAGHRAAAALLRRPRPELLL
jgi:sugar/nucleoside kinase (ribokinase family)